MFIKIFSCKLGSNAVYTPGSKTDLTSGWNAEVHQKGGLEGHRRITLQHPNLFNDPFGYGLRVVGQQQGSSEEGSATHHNSTLTRFARVLWCSPGGVAETSGICVGDRVSLRYYQIIYNIHGIIISSVDWKFEHSPIF